MGIFKKTRNLDNVLIVVGWRDRYHLYNVPLSPLGPSFFSKSNRMSSMWESTGKKEKDFSEFHDTSHRFTTYYYRVSDSAGALLVL
jgi:hypothetical protein